MLHLVNKSPFERNTLDACLKRAETGAAILLIEDAVYAAMRGTGFADTIAGAAARHAVHVLGPDLAARGIAPDALVADITIVDHAGFVDLVVDQGPVVSWL